MPDDAASLQLDAAIDMAVYSGNVLYEANDEAHAWALTLIASNLFELAGDGQSSADRFADGFSKIAMKGTTDPIILGWDSVSIARAIRNWINHGAQLDRPQEMNRDTRIRAKAVSVGFIPLAAEGDSDDFYRVYFDEEEGFLLLFSPNRFWIYVKRWYESRTR